MRKLSAIVATDVVGYSRMIRVDEEGTLAALKAIREQIVNPKIAEHHGRIVKLMGDGLLAEFGSVVDAVRNAVEVQKAVADLQADVSEDQRITFRVGINLGDVVVDGDDIQGDGVNMASRLEAFSAPGGVCISSAVHEQVQDRLDIEFEDMGEQAFKNIDRPVQVWQWVPEGENAPVLDHPASGTEEYASARVRSLGDVSVADKGVMNRPAVLFLPFQSLGRSEDDAILASGLCEDIRTTLASWRWFPVIGPEALGGLTDDVKGLAASVGATYVMTGSVRRSGERARVIARLIDGNAGSELWSQSFEGNLQDVFAFQDDVSQRIVSQIEPEIAHAAAARIPINRPRGLASWELMAKAADVERKGGDGYGTKDANEAQRRIVLEAIQGEPDLCEAWARLARCHFRDFLLGWVDDRAAALRESLNASARAVEIDPGSSIARSYRAQCMLFGNHDPKGALVHAQEAVRLNPSNVSGHIMMGCVLVFYGEPDRAFAHYETALRLNPNFPNMGVILCDQMMCRALVGEMDQAIALARKMIIAAPKYYRGLQRCAAVMANAGELEEAREVLLTTEKIGGKFSEVYLRETYPFVVEKDLEFLISGLRLAGWRG
jgi:adenylate cyclase